MKLSRQLRHQQHSHHFLYLLIILLIIISSMSTFAMAQANQVVVRANFLNVRVGPSLSYSTMTQVKRGETLTIIGQKNQWYQVRLASDKIGWVASWLIDNTEANASGNSLGVIKAPNTNVRQYPDSQAEVLGSLAQSQRVNIVYTQNEWSQILYNNTVGWIPNSEMIITDKVPSHIKNTQPNSHKDLNIQSVTTLQNNTKIYARASVDAPVTAHITDQTTLQYLGTKGDFYKIRLNSGDTGYIASRLVSISDTKHQIKSAATNLSEAVIVLDPGHGGRDTGALATSGKHFEKNYTLDVAERLQQKLHQTGANVVLTRSADHFVDLAPRARLSNKLSADAFISLHFDSTSNKSQASGLTTYYYSRKKDFRLAQTIHQHLHKLALLDRGVFSEDYEVTRENEQPAILIEGGYINNPKDFKKINSPQYREQLADAIYQGLVQYFK